MTPDVIAAYSTAIVAVIGAVTALILAIRPILMELRKNTAISQKAAKVGEETHRMVNSQREAGIEQQTRTDNALRAAGIPIPHNPAAEIQVSGTEAEEQWPSSD